MDERIYKNEDVTILIAEDDDGHAELIRDHLRESGVANLIHRFADGQDLLDFFFNGGQDIQYEPGRAYLLLLDIRMPRVDGVEVLRRLKSHASLRNLPVIMLTTTDDPREVETCYSLGCNMYITKPVNFAVFADTLRRLGLFVLVVRIAPVNG